MNISVIGGGAGGFFAAISAATHHPKATVTLYEKTTKLLTKVSVSGGGRCNITHACADVNELIKAYPRGGKQLKTSFNLFGIADVIAWFASKNVPFKTEEDGRMFPQTNTSQTVVDCLLNEAISLGVIIKMQTEILKVTPQNITQNTLQNIKKQGFLLDLKQKETENIQIYTDKVIIATGGGSKLQNFDWLAELGHTIISPVPSLFTFNMPKNDICTLMGVSVPSARVQIQKTKLNEVGALMITHWGMSGPAILKTSAWGARLLSEMNYQFVARVSWLSDISEENLREKFYENKKLLNVRQINNKNPFGLPKRLWEFFLENLQINPEKRWTDLSKSEINKLTNKILNDLYEVRGKTTFKEEFVTCGGVSLADISMKTMESLHIKGLFFTGEVLDIDGITGGYNFQAAWTTAWLAGKNV